MLNKWRKVGLLLKRGLKNKCKCVSKSQLITLWDQRSWQYLDWITQNKANRARKIQQRERHFYIFLAFLPFISRLDETPKLESWETLNDTSISLLSKVNMTTVACSQPGIKWMVPAWLASFSRKHFPLFRN